MKDNLVWTKTLLTVYRYLERISGAIDKIIMQRALSSRNLFSQNYFYNNVMSVSQKIIDLSERKVTIINLKVLIEQVLEKMCQEDALILIEKYFDGLKVREIADKHGKCMRTVFRKLENSLQAFAINLRKCGFSDAKLAKMLENECWINNVYSRLAKDEDDISLSNVYLARAASM